MTLDILGAISLLYGDCSQEPGGPILIGDTEATEEQLAAAEIRAQIEADSYAGLQYARDRRKAYASLNQDEMRFDDLINNTTTWQDAILAIKAEFPKETI